MSRLSPSRATAEPDEPWCSAEGVAGRATSPGAPGAAPAPVGAAPSNPARPEASNQLGSGVAGSAAVPGSPPFFGSLAPECADPGSVVRTAAPESPAGVPEPPDPPPAPPAVRSGTTAAPAGEGAGAAVAGVDGGAEGAVGGGGHGGGQGVRNRNARHGHEEGGEGQAPPHSSQQHSGLPGRSRISDAVDHIGGDPASVTSRNVPKR